MHSMQGKLPDVKRASLQSFEEVSDSVVDDLKHIRSATQSALEEEDVERPDYVLKTTVKT